MDHRVLFMSTTDSTHSAVIDLSKDTDRLPMSALLALAMTGFICILTETLPAGMLPLIGSSLDISPALVGQMVTAYALGSLLAAIPLTIVTQSWSRRTVLLLTIVGFLLFNSITALSPDYVLTLTARFFAGVSAGLAWSLLAGYARRMVAPHQQGRAMAIAMVGTPIALSLGLPLGTWLGSLLGWRITFGVMSLLSVLLIVWVLIKVPNYPGQTRSSRIPLYSVLSIDGVRSILGVVVTWMLAHNLLYTYIAPFLGLAGLDNQVDVVLLIFGMAALLGIWCTSRLVDRYLRIAVLISLLLFALVSLLFSVWGTLLVAVFVGVFIWGLTFGGAATLLQTALADAAGESTDVAISINVVAWNGAIAAGGIFGGLILQAAGAGTIPWVMFFLLIVAFALTWTSKKNGFPSGHR